MNKKLNFYKESKKVLDFTGQYQGGTCLAVCFAMLGVEIYISSYTAVGSDIGFENLVFGGT